MKEFTVYPAGREITMTQCENRHYWKISIDKKLIGTIYPQDTDMDIEWMSDDGVHESLITMCGNLIEEKYYEQED